MTGSWIWGWTIMLPATTNVVGNFRLCNLVPRALQKTHQSKTRGFFNSYCGVPWGTDMYRCIFPYVYIYIILYIFMYIYIITLCSIWKLHDLCSHTIFPYIHPTFSHENLPFLGDPDLARPGLRRWGGDHRGLELLRFSAENLGEN